ncbi:hypothetical protein MKEN_00365400 [Mycena kentingensis (nom. inval.)]|nr:hypothetical protein MKEN_00365400 [Mycena kentingensis (nom. inval.)]
MLTLPPRRLPLPRRLPPPRLLHTRSSPLLRSARPHPNPIASSLPPISSAYVWRCRALSPPFQQTSAFHSTPSRNGLPFIPLLGVLKASATMELVRTAGRIVLTILPVILIKNHKTRRHLRHAALTGVVIPEEQQDKLRARIRSRTLFFHALVLIPAVLFWGTIFASLERTPLTGRWRLIVLSPEEEDEIANQLAGNGWYQAVNEILANDGPVQLIPPSDWRYQWVKNTLRQLECTIPILIDEQKAYRDWVDGGNDDLPLPPPAEYPLRPRPRGTEYLRMFCESMCNRTVPPVPHSIPGPPYSLLVVDKPDASNAFSYGFGPEGGGGVVVYSGFLDEILARAPPEDERVQSVQQGSVFSSFFGLLNSAPAPSLHPAPTPSQTAELAILLSHELAHLVLSHHLETLSSATIIMPGIMSILSDVLRVAIFPFTMIFGPFVNDAVAQLGKIGTGELEKVGEYCTSVKQEIEADVVSARLLAHAGYDARKAVTFWEHRSATECSSTSERKDEYPSVSFVHKITGSQHPVTETRVKSLRDELRRWETERRAVVARRAMSAEKTVLLYYATNLLAILGPRTLALRVVLLPITLYSAYTAATSLDLARTLVASHPERFFYLNQALALAQFIVAVRTLLRTFGRTPKREHRPSTKGAGLQLLLDAADLTFCLRGIGWSFSANLSIPAETRPTRTRAAFLGAVARSLLAHAAVFDILQYAAQALSSVPVGSTEGYSVFDTQGRTTLRTYIHTLLVGICIYGSIQIGYDGFALVGVGVFRMQPAQWPPAFDAPWRATSLAEFWGRRWHQVFRQDFVGVGAKPGAVVAGRVGAVLGAFGVSGLLHVAGLWGMRGEADARLVMFFLVMGVGVLLEGGWRRVVGKNIGGVFGVLWTFGWILGWGWLFADPWCLSGVMGSVFIPYEYRPAVILHRLVE